ncbi:MAG: efflux RND transporter periplasmic adaptor subunit [Candidatus Acidiferrales bacterium]
MAVIAAAIVVAVVVWLAVRPDGSRSSGVAQAGTAVARAGDFVKVVRLAGSTDAVRSRPILVPTLEGATLTQLVVTQMRPAGARVKKGELLAEFDRQAQLKDALDKRAAYQDLVDKVEEKRAAEVAARAKDETDIQTAEDALKKARLEVSKNDIVSRIDAEKNRETLDEAVATLKQLQQTFKLKREAAAADIRSTAIQADRAKETMLYAESNASRMRLVSPMDGVVVLNMIWTGSGIGEAKEGDSLRPGLPFMKVVDPSQMNVSVEVNQADFLKLHVGQRARVYLDAYPSMAFSGHLEELSPMAHTSQFSESVRTFTATFALDGNNPKLMPDLSAAVGVELDSVKDAVTVPIQSVGTDGGREYVWVRAGHSFVKRAVTVGPRNDLDVVIASGLKAGDVVRRDVIEPSVAGI